MTLTRENNNKYKSIKRSLLFNAAKLRQEYGRNNLLLHYTTSDEKLYSVNVTNTHCKLIYQNNKYTFKSFIRPYKPKIIEFKQLYGKEYKKPYEETFQKYLETLKKYMLYEGECKHFVSHYEVWICSVNKCRNRIIVDTLTNKILPHWNKRIPKQHSHLNSITNEILIKMELHDTLELNLLQNMKYSKSVVYKDFNSKYFHLFSKNEQDLIPQKYNGALNKKMSRMKNKHKLSRDNNLEIKIKQNQINKFDKLTNSIDQFSYNPDLNFNQEQYLIPEKQKSIIVNELEESKEDGPQLRNLMNKYSSEKLLAMEKERMICDFAKSLNPNLKDYSIHTLDFIEEGSNIFMLFTLGGLKMLDKKYCNIIACDATFGLSPQTQLWRKINKSYYQVKK